MTARAVIADLAARYLPLGFTWRQALHAVARGDIREVERIQRARVALDDDWAERIYESAWAEAFEEPTRETPMHCDEEKTEAGEGSEPLTVNGVILRLVALRAAHPEVGPMRFVAGEIHKEIFRVAVAADREAPICEDDYVVVAR